MVNAVVVTEDWSLETIDLIEKYDVADNLHSSKDLTPVVVEVLLKVVVVAWLIQSETEDRLDID